MKTQMKTKLLPLAAAVLAIGALGTVHAATQTDAEEAWIAGKLEGTYGLNPHLSAFAIKTDVQDGVVTLSGKVESDIDRDLAIELAKGIKGVTKVVATQLVSSEDAHHADGENRGEFARWVDDATTTASVKSKLIGNKNILARDINVDTAANVVTLRGNVSSKEEKQLAGQLAENTDGVRSVHNELVVASR